MGMKMLLSVLGLLVCMSASAGNGVGQAHPSARGVSYTYPQSYEQWQHSFFAGNGKTGIILFGDPISESVVFTSRMFNFPSAVERSFAVVPKDTVEKISALCAQGLFSEANSLAVSSSQWKDGGEGGRHPGFMMKIDMPVVGEVRDYSRECDYSTGEISVKWSDDCGKWERKCFVSRDEDVMVMKITHDGEHFDCKVSMSLPAGAHFPDGMTVIGRHPGKSMSGIDVRYARPFDSQGFSGLVKAESEDGSIGFRNDTLMATGVKELTLVAKVGKFKDSETGMDSLVAELAGVNNDYDGLFSHHSDIHSDIYNRVTVDFGADDASRALPNEVLLKMQKESDTPVPALWERLFYAGRYHFLSSGNEITPPDLLGIWTGDCNVGWGGYYHLDANLNLQVSSGNVCNMPEVMEGYFNLNEVWAKDFERNARDLLGCRGMVACGNTPGLSSGLMASINEYYPYHYATGEEGWLLYPFWEYYQTTGDKVFLKDRLLPLLEKMGDFYEDFLRHKDADGKYILTGSVSPENRPSNLPVSLLNNSAFDVAGARWCLSTLVKTCDILGVYQEPGGRRAKWQELYISLPGYRINADDAVSEWGWEGLEDHYHHRHSSHLMMVWPYREVSPVRYPDWYVAAGKALDMRDRYDYENAGHGYLHAALIAAVLGNRESFASKMNNLTRRDFFYDGLVSAHYPDYGVFCTDVCNSLPGLVAEMLVGSDEDGIHLLPALVEGLPKGSVTGLKTRCGVTVERMDWDVDAGTVTVAMRSLSPHTVRLNVGDNAPEIVTVPDTTVVKTYRMK